jgi:hypothetical protein
MGKDPLETGIEISNTNDYVTAVNQKLKTD